MAEDQELRKVLKLMLTSFKMYQVRALSTNAALNWIMQLPPTSRAQLTRPQLENQVEQAIKQAQPLVDQRSSALENKLEGENEFLETLRVFASQQLWK